MKTQKVKNVRWKGLFGAIGYLSLAFVITILSVNLLPSLKGNVQFWFAIALTFSNICLIYLSLEELGL